jgi:2-polyprenyl-3-methyl-5-hydroxy-6-metoxy-1,4-benzoquinol methylase
MDLKETHSIHATRHPWETARLNALRKILQPVLFEGIKVLDVGCGDGFISRGLFGTLRNKDVTAVDINLSDEWIRVLTTLSQGMRFQREMPAEGERYDLILLLDVIEHIEADREFLADLVTGHLSPKGKVMITAPAFQSIYGRHDDFLGHYRRYNHNGMMKLTASCGLTVLSSGYLFFSLLLPKLVIYKLLNLGYDTEGVGNWRKGKVVTALFETLFNIDNSLLIQAARLGIRIPGLTVWTLCEKRG